MMKRDNRYAKLYFEALRQTRVIGIIFVVILTVSSLLLLINGYINSISFIEQMKIEDPNYVHSPEIISFTEFNPLYIALPFVMAPLLALTAFSFLNKRNSSDFYHAITQKRSTLFLSCASASFTWLIVAAVASTGIGIITALCFSNIFIINWSTLIYMLEGLVASLYVFAATTLATTATGTLFNNICLTGIIIVVPRVLMYLLAESVMGMVNVLPSINNLGILSPRYNLIFRYIIGLNSTVDYASAPLIYTLIIGIIYFIIAFVSFIKRHSETAGQSAPNRFLQAAYRIAFVMLICSPACFLIALDIEAGYTGDIIAIIAIYIFALIAWFVYELITTRKAGNLLKTIPSLSILVLLNVAMIVTSLGIKYNIESFRPEPEEIEYLIFTESDYDFYGYDYMSLYEYLVGDLGDIEIKDANAIKIVSDSLKTTIDGIDPLDLIDTTDTAIPEKYWQTTTNITVGIKTSSGLKYRTIDMTDGDVEVIKNALFDTIVNERKLNDMPNVTDIVLNSYLDLDKSQALEVYGTLYKEFSEMNKKQILEAAADSTEISSMNITTTIGLKEISIHIPITLKMRQTSSKLIELLNSEALIEDALINGLPSTESELGSSVNLEIYDGGRLAYSWYGNMTEFELCGMADILRDKIDEEIDVSDKMVYVNLHYFEGTGKEVAYSSSRYISLTGIEFEDLPGYFKENASEYIN